MVDVRSATEPELAVRLPSIDALFVPFDARPLAQRPLAYDVHDYLLDEWERVRAASPAVLTLILPESERGDADEAAVRAAVRADLRASRGPLRRVDPLSRREKVELRAGAASLFACIALATALERLSNSVFVEGVAQAITVVGWVALWAPVAHFFKEVVPHAFNRRRYAELADLDVRVRWT